MRLIRRNTITGEHSTRNYPCAIDQPVSGQPEEIQWYKEVIASRPPHDYRTHRLVKSEEWTTDPWEGHAHILIYEIDWELEQLSNEVIKENLTAEYVAWKYDQYSREARDSDNDRRVQISYLIAKELPHDEVEEARQLAIGAWQQTISDEYHAQKNALLDDGTLPSFSFTQFPSA
jgi:hypothetical protein